MSNIDSISDKWGFAPGDIAARIAAKRSAFDAEGFTRSLKSRIYGQDPIVDAIARQLRIRISRPSKRKPLALMFAGPSSVGKTETSKLIADALGMSLYIEPCNLLKESHKVSSITGSTLGYADSGKEPAIVQALNKANGRLVIILDEFEKAHPDVAAVFLSILDEGALKAAGADHDFRRCIFIATSNAGIQNFDFASDRPGSPASFEHIKKAMGAAFLPELMNRFAALYMFQPLGDVALQHLVADQVEALISDYHKLDVGGSRDGMREFVGQVLAGFGDAAPNGRTLGNAVEQLLIPQLDDIAAGQMVRIDADGRIRPC